MSPPRIPSVPSTRGVVIEMLPRRNREPTPARTLLTQSAAAFVNLFEACSAAENAIQLAGFRALARQLARCLDSLVELQGSSFQSLQRQVDAHSILSQIPDLAAHFCSTEGMISSCEFQASRHFLAGDESELLAALLMVLRREFESSPPSSLQISTSDHGEPGLELCIALTFDCTDRGFLKPLPDQDGLAFMHRLTISMGGLCRNSSSQRQSRHEFFFPTMSGSMHV